jgi:hypothetical protein
MTGNLIAFYNSTDCFSGLEKSTLRNIEWLVQDGNEILIISTQGTPFTIAARQKGFKVVELDKAVEDFANKACCCCQTP